MNLHALAGASTSRMYVYQFRHPCIFKNILCIFNSAKRRNLCPGWRPRRFAPIQSKAVCFVSTRAYLKIYYNKSILISTSKKSAEGGFFVIFSFLQFFQLLSLSFSLYQCFLLFFLAKFRFANVSLILSLLFL